MNEQIEYTLVAAQQSAIKKLDRMNRKGKIIIEGVTDDGRPFRPSDWIERISGSLSSFGNDRRMRYSNYVQPQMILGKKCLVIDTALQERNAAAFNFLIDFAKGNRLRMQEVVSEPANAVAPTLVPAGSSQAQDPTPTDSPNTADRRVCTA